MPSATQMACGAPQHSVFSPAKARYLSSVHGAQRQPPRTKMAQETTRRVNSARLLFSERRKLRVQMRAACSRLGTALFCFSQCKPVDDEDALHAGEPRYLITDAAMAGGMSGGPVLNSAGKTLPSPPTYIYTIAGLNACEQTGGLCLVVALHETALPATVMATDARKGPKAEPLSEAVKLVVAWEARAPWPCDPGFAFC